MKRTDLVAGERYEITLVNLDNALPTQGTEPAVDDPYAVVLTTQPVRVVSALVEGPRGDHVPDPTVTGGPLVDTVTIAEGWNTKMNRPETWKRKPAVPGETQVAYIGGRDALEVTLHDGRVLTTPSWKIPGRSSRFASFTGREGAFVIDPKARGVLVRVFYTEPDPGLSDAEAAAAGIDIVVPLSYLERTAAERDAERADRQAALEAEWARQEAQEAAEQDEEERMLRDWVAAAGTTAALEAVWPAITDAVAARYPDGRTDDDTPADAHVDPQDQGRVSVSVSLLLDLLGLDAPSVYAARHAAPNN